MQALGRWAVSARPLCLAELQGQVAACVSSVQGQLLAPWRSPVPCQPSSHNLQPCQVAWYRSTIDHQGKGKKNSAAGAADKQPAPDGSGSTNQEASASAGSPNAEALGLLDQRPLKSILQVPVPSNQLDSEHVGNYYQLQPALLPEAFPALYQSFYASRDSRERPRSGGCGGLQQEMAAVAGAQGGSTPILMHRRVTAGVWEALAHGSTAGRGGVRVLLRGPGGAGKSCTLAALVERARQSGWLAVYIPSATALVKGGLFEACPTAEGTDGPRQWDTPISAMHVLLGVQQAHGKALAGMPVRLEATRQLLPATPQPESPTQLQMACNPTAPSSTELGGASISTADVSQPGRAEETPVHAPATGASSEPNPSSLVSPEGSEAGKAVEAPAAAGSGTQSPAPSTVTLNQLITHGLAADDAHTPVTVVLALMEELVAAAGAGQPVLLAVDDYNALYGETGYGVHERLEGVDGPQGIQRVPLRVVQLRLANSMRFLEKSAAQLGAVHVVAATSHSVAVSRRVRVPLAAEARAAEVFVPRYSQVELAHALYHYYECGTAPEPPTQRSVSRLMLLTNGNASEARQLAVTSSLLRVKGKLLNNWSL